MKTELNAKELVEAARKLFPKDIESFQKLQESYLPYIDKASEASK